MTGTLGKVHFSGIYEKVKAKDWKAAEKLAREAFDDDSITEPELAQICDLVFYTNAEQLYGFLGEFLEKYPSSVFATKAQFATLLATRGNPDLATELAREHLRALRDRGALAHVKNAVPLTDGAVRAVLILTAAYTLVGARSYNLRVLELGRRYLAGVPEALKAIEKKESALRQELAQAEYRAQDQAWEKFFETGEGSDDLIASCRTLELEGLARRVELLADRISHEPGFEINEDEIFLLVRVSRAKGESDGDTIVFLG